MKHLTSAAIIKVLFVTFLLSPGIFAEVEEVRRPENGTYLLWSMGDLVEARDPRLGETHRHQWIYELIGGFIMNTYPVDNLRMTINFEIGTYNVFPRVARNGDGEPSQDTKFDTYIEEAKGVFSFGNAAPTAFELEFGYFASRYNSSARVFGEYLFRSMIYPSVLFNNFDNPWYYLSGARIGHKINDNFSHNLYMLTEFDHWPFFDFSLAYEFNLSLMDMFELGAGINAKRVIPVRPSLSSPDIPLNTHVTIPAQTAYITDSAGVVTDTLVIAEEQSGLLDAQNRLPQIDDAYKVDRINHEILPGINHEKTNYSFQGLVAMGRFSWFPLGFSSDEKISRMLSLYSETAVLGWKNYPLVYENRDERMPVMGGVQFNFPGIIDVLAFEVEYFKSKTPPSFFFRGRENVPLPGDYLAAPTDSAEAVAEVARLEKDDLKWIVYARKSFKGLALALQVGTDHMRRDIDEVPGRPTEILTRPSQWYWQLRVRIPF